MRAVKFAILAGLVTSILVGAGMAQLNVSISSSGNVVGQTKELTVSAQAAVAVLGTATVMPVCAGQLAASFADTPTVSLAWGSSLSSNSDEETFFCIGNIGASAGTVHVTVTNGANGETLTLEQCTAGVLGLTFTALDGASIAGSGVIAVRAHLHTPTVGLNANTALTSKASLTFS